MKGKRISILIGIAVCLGLVFSYQNTPDHKLLFEKAKFAMETKGDLQGAIKLFKEIVAKYPKEKEYAAKAQLYIGLCYEKLGNSEAVKAYELVLKNFADRPEEVAVARERLAALKQASSPTSSSMNIPFGAVPFDPFALSPDGTKIVGMNYDNGENVVVYDMVRKRTDFLTRFDLTESSFWTDCPVWSPDGREIAYEQVPNKKGAQGSEIRIMDLEGRSRIVSRTDEGDLWADAWLPKSRTLVALRFRPDKTYEIGLVPVEGGVFKLLCAVRGGPWGPGVSCSPDEQFLVFSEGQPGARDIRIIGLDGRGSHLLVEHPADDRNPFWSPDGGHIVFFSNREGGKALWGLAVENGMANGKPFLIEEMHPSCELLGWTSQGLAYTKTREIDNVYIQPIDAAAKRLLGEPTLIPHTAPGHNSSLRWAPDGRQVAFVSTTEELPSRVRIVVQPVDGKKPREFLSPAYQWYPSGHSLAWSPNGRKLGFATFGMNTDDGRGALMILDLASGEWRLHHPQDFNYAGTNIEWSGDDDKVYYWQGGSVNDPGIVEYDLNSASVRPILKPDPKRHLDFSPLRLSPDRRQLAFHFTEVDVPAKMTMRHISVLDIGTGSVQEVYSGTDGTGIPVWSPDGKSLLVLCGCEPTTAGGEAGSDLGILSVHGGKVERLNVKIDWPTGDGYQHTLTSPDWSPDGTKIAFTAHSVKNELYLMKNVIPEDRKK